MSDILLTTGVDQSGFNTGMAVLRTEVAKTGIAIQRDLASAFSLSSLVAGTISVGALKNLIEYGSRIQDLSDRFRVSTTTLQQFGNAAELVGVPLESVAASFNRLDVARAKALSGNAELLASFERLGVSANDLRNLSLDQIMLKLGSSSFNAADAVKLLGRNATELRPLLQGLADDTIKLGDAMDPKLIANLDKADDTWTKLWQKARITGANIVQPFLDAFNKIGDLFEDFDFSKPAEFAKKIGSAVSAYSKVTLAPFLGPLGGKLFGGDSEAPSLSKLDQQIAGLKQQIASLEAQPVSLEVTADTGAAQSEIADLKKQLAALEERKVGPVAGGGESDDFGNARPAGADSAARELLKTQEKAASLSESIGRGERARFLDSISSQEKLNLLEGERASVLQQQQNLIDQGKTDSVEYLTLAQKRQTIEGEITQTQKQQAADEEKSLDLAQKEQQSAAQSLADSREAAEEDQLRLQGREDLAEQAKTAYEFDQKIAEAQAGAADAAEEARNAKTEGEREAFQAVVATNTALAEQLGLEKNVAIAALQKAQAEKEAAEVAKLAAQLEASNADVENVNDKIGALKEQSAEQEQIRQGHSDIAEKMRDEYEAQKKIDAISQDITDAQDEQNDLWGKAAQAWAQGDNQAAQYYTQLAKSKGVLIDSLGVLRQMTAEEAKAKEIADAWAKGMQNLANNAASLLDNVNNILQNTTAGQALLKQYGPGAQQLLVNPNVPAVQQAVVEAGGGAIDPQRLNQLMAQQALIALQGGDISRLVNQQALNNMVAAQVEAAMRNMPGHDSQQIEQLKNIAAGLLVYSSKLGQYVSPDQLAQAEHGRGPLAASFARAQEQENVLSLQGRIAAAQQAAAAASSAGNVAEEQKQITLQAQLQTQLDQARTGLTASQQAQRAQDTINERKAIELDYQNKINAATAAHNDALVAQLAAEEKNALALFDKAHPPGTEGGASPADLSVVEAVQKSIEASKEAVAELQAKAAGASDDAISKMRTRFDFEQRIAEVQKAATEARAAGNSALADANDALAKQLAAEEQITLQQQNQLQLNKLISDSRPTYEEDDLRSLLSRFNAVRLAHSAAVASAASFNIPPPAPAPSAAAGPQISQLVNLMGDVIISLRDMGKGIESIRRNTYVLPGT